MINKIALVTGGSRGLGKDMALSLAKKGIDVIVTYNSNRAEAENVVAEIKAANQNAAALQLDMTMPGNLDKFLSELSSALADIWNTDKFDYLVHNAGFGATIPMADATEEIFDQLVNVHYKSVYFLTQKSVSHMNNGGGIVFISSGTTRFCVPGYSIYSSLKGAVEVLSKFVAKELGARGIRSNVVAPGPVETDFNNAAIRNNPQMQGYLSSVTALGRIAHADDIGSVVAFLCTDDAKWVNGQRIEVSGGINL